MGLLGFNNFADMFDGGGAGKAGQTFEGGPLSGLLNAIGIRPAGYMDRLAEKRPQSRPVGLLSNPQAAPMPPSQPMIGNMTPEQILEAIMRSQPPAIGALPVPAPTALPAMPDMLRMDAERRAQYGVPFMLGGGY